MSIFIYSELQNFSVSLKAQNNYFFNCADESICMPGWGGAVVSIGACGASDSSANLDPDLYSNLREVF